MALDNQTVKHIAALARIGVEADELEGYATELSKILEFVARMERVDTQAVEPLPHPRDRLLTMRDDRVTESDQRDEFQRVAPAVEDGLYLVPRVIE